MDLSEQPFEALVLKCLSFSFSTAVINSFFTWVAVITAAVRLWRIRAVGSTSPDSQPRPQYSDESRDPSLPELTPLCNWVVEEEEEAAPSGRAKSEVKSFAVSDGDGTVKGKFTAYYVTDVCVGEDEEEVTEVEGWSDGEADGVCEFEEWVAKRTRDLGWYRYHDLTVINGNVVRLWDGVSRWSSSPLC